jgi:hypothetical protein
MQAITGNRTRSLAAAIALTFVAATASADTFSKVTTYAGDPKSNKVLQEPYAVVVLPSGELLVSDTKNHRIRRVSTSGAVTVFAGSGKQGSKDGAAAVAELKDPRGLAYDRVRNVLYVADSGNDRIRKIAADGTVSTLAISGLKKPSGVAVDADGNVYVADTGHHVICRITLAQVMTVVAGTSRNGADDDDENDAPDTEDNQYTDGPALQATFDAPAGLAIAPGGVLYIVDSNNDAVRKLEAGVVSTVAGGKRSGFVDGPALSARFDQPTGIALDSDGNLVIADTGNHRIRKVTLGTTRAVSTIAGSGSSGLVDGAPATARFKSPRGVAFAGTIFVADSKNNVIRAIYPALTITSVTPAVAAAAAEVRIAGSGFVNGQTAVAFGSQPAARVTFVSSTELLAAVPALPSGRYDVNVTVSGATATLAGGFTLDADPPAISATAAPTPNAAGWNNANVRVTFLCTDALSGIASCTAPVDVITEGAALVVTGLAVDRAGNQKSLGVTVKLDKGLPVIVAAVTPVPNAAGWTKADTTVRFDATDALSGVSSVTPPATVTTETAGQQVTGRALDAAGNAAEKSIAVKMDKTAPLVTANATPVANAAGWNKDDVTVTFHGTDALSGVASTDPPKTIGVEGSREVRGTVTDAAGNSGTAAVTVNLDKTAPAIETVLAPAANAAGWNNRDVTVTFAAADPLSGVATSSAPVVVSTEGDAVTVSGTATDKAGNAATASATVKLDKTAPSITANAFPTQPDRFAPDSSWIRGGATVAFLCSDELSGVDTCEPEKNVTTEGRDQQIGGTAVDAAGNRATVTLPVSIDSTPPVLQVAAAPAAVKTATYTFEGTVSDALSGLRVLTCGGTAATVSGSTFTCTTSLFEGENTIAIAAMDGAGNRTAQQVPLVSDRESPALHVDAPHASETTNGATLAVSATVTDNDRIASVTVNGVPLVGADEVYTATLPLEEGTNNVVVVATDRAGNSTTVSSVVTRFSVPAVAISTPADLAVIGVATTSVSGTVGNPAAAVTVNGVPASVSGGAFHAGGVALAQGRTVITAVAKDPAGHVASASINVYRDAIPPRVIVYAPRDNATVYDPVIDVNGMVDDIVVGTINPAQVHVTVNGTEAVVSNRGFVVRGLTLSPGLNTLTVRAQDQGGNAVTVTHRVTFQSSAGLARLAMVSGNGQTAVIGQPLPEPLVVRLTSAAGTPVAGQTVVFNVVTNNGSLSGGAASGRHVEVKTNGRGEASVSWTLGMRAGAAINRVEARATGFTGSAGFDASGQVGPAALLVADGGSGQFAATSGVTARPLVAVAVDAGSNRVAGVPVTFKVVEGGGSFDGEQRVTVTTDSDGRAWATPMLGPEAGSDNNVFAASVAAEPNAGVAVYFLSGRAAGPAAQTRITGVVLDNSDQPVPGVSVRIDGTALVARSDAQGQFILSGVPVGYVKLFIDGSTAQRPGTWPVLEFAMYTVPGTDNTIGMPVYLLPIDTVRGIAVSETVGGTLTLPELPGFSLTVAPGAATFPGGARTGTIAVTLVHADKMPMAPGFGQQPRFIVTIQPPGVHFDPPAAIAFPNVDGLGPGEITELYSFDHDLGQFIAIGTGSVSEDGSVLRSDPGIGIIKGGWHCGGNPSSSGTPANCGPCATCNGTNCVATASLVCHTCGPNKRCSSGGKCQQLTAAIKAIITEGADRTFISTENLTFKGAANFPCVDGSLRWTSINSIQSGSLTPPTGTGPTYTGRPHPPAATGGRNYPLSYKVRMEIDSLAAETTVTQDDVDRIRQQYIDMSKTRVVDRFEFIHSLSTSPSGWFTFADVNSPDESNFAVFTVFSNVEYLRELYGQDFPKLADYPPSGFSRGYSTPRHNATIAGAGLNTQHIYGRAVDIATGGLGFDLWKELWDVAKAAGACAEPWSMTGDSHVHADWREGGCPAGW